MRKNTYADTLKLGLDKRGTAPVGRAARKTYSYMLTESQRLRNEEVRHLRRSYIKGENNVGIPQDAESLEPIFIGIEFPFDLPSPKLQRMKQLLMSGVSIEIVSTDLPNGYSEKNTPEVVAAFFVVNGVEYRREMRVVHGECVTETPCESVMQLGSACGEARRIMDALSAGCNVYLIPEENCGVFGLYTLCVVASPLSK